MDLTKVPKKIDNAKVLYVAEVDPRKAVTYFSDWGKPPVERFAICQYDHNSNYFIFVCSKDWDFITGQSEYSLKRAKKLAFQFTPESVEWHSIESDPNEKKGGQA